MKSYTDLEQSKKLAKFLPHDSADIAWYPSYAKDGYSIRMLTDTYPLDIIGDEQSDEIPAWSLAALLDIIRKAIGYTLEAIYDKNPKVFIECELGDKPYSIESTEYDNEVDACYEMILNLHELHLL